MTARAADAARITSTGNARVVAARRLRTARHRNEAGAFLVEGPHAVAEALASGTHQVRELFVADARAAQLADLVARARGLGISIHHVSDRVLAALAETRSPQGVVGVVADPRPRLDQLLASGPSLVTVLVGVADPGNAGTIIRTCDAFGVDAVLLTERSVDPHNGKCVRASAGSLFHLPVLDAGPAATAVDALHVAGLTTLAATPHGGTPLDSDEVTGLLSMPVAWLFGSEAHGLADDTLGRAAVRVRIPTPGAAESLNLAASAAVCLYATAQARTHGPLRGASPR